MTSSSIKIYPVYTLSGIPAQNPPGFGSIWWHRTILHTTIKWLTMWGTCTGIQSLGDFTYQPARNYPQGAKVILPSLCFPARWGIHPSSNPDKKTDSDPWATGLLCQAAKSSKTTAQTQAVNTSVRRVLALNTPGKKTILRTVSSWGKTNICLWMSIF